MNTTLTSILRCRFHSDIKFINENEITRSISDLRAAYKYGPWNVSYSTITINYLGLFTLSKPHTTRYIQYVILPNPLMMHRVPTN